jgi:hypothetical protein
MHSVDRCWSRGTALVLVLASGVLSLPGNANAAPDLIVTTPNERAATTGASSNPLAQQVALGIPGIHVKQHVYTLYRLVDDSHRADAVIELANDAAASANFDLSIGTVTLGWWLRYCSDPADSATCETFSASSSSADRTKTVSVPALGSVEFSLQAVPIPDKLLDTETFSVDVQATLVPPVTATGTSAPPEIDVVRLNIDVNPATRCEGFKPSGSLILPFFFTELDPTAPLSQRIATGARPAVLIWETPVGGDTDPFSWTNTTASPPISFASDMRWFYADCLLGGLCDSSRGERQTEPGGPVSLVSGSLDLNTPVGAGFRLLKRLPGNDNRVFGRGTGARRVYTSLDGVTRADFGLTSCSALSTLLLPGAVFTGPICTANPFDRDPVKDLIRYTRGGYNAADPRSESRDMDRVRNYGNAASGDHGGDEQWKLGDVLRSTPLIIGAPTAGYKDPTYLGLDFATEQRSGFAALHRERPLTAYALSNYGMLHAIRLGQWAIPGQFSPAWYTMDAPASQAEELWAYVPRGVLSKLQDAAGPDHRFVADGLLRSIDVLDGTDWHTLLVGHSGRGGEGLYVLDVTDPENPAVWFDLTKSEIVDPDGDGTPDYQPLGDTISAPALGKLGSRWVAIFGSGTRADEVVDKYVAPAYLTIVDLTGTDKGKVTKQVQVSAKPGNMLTELRAIRKLSDPSINVDGEIDRIYFGDIYGALWRVGEARLQSLSDGGSLSETDDMLFKPADYGSAARAFQAARPITVRPVTAGDGEVTWVFFGTGDYGPVQANPPNQAFYGLKDLQGVGGLGSGIAGLDRPYEDTDLVDMTVATASGGTPAPINASRDSWRIVLGQVDAADVILTGGGSLKDANERVLAPASVFSGIVFLSTFQPEADQCLGGIVRVYAVDFQRGALREGLFRIADASGTFLTTVRSVEVAGNGVPTQAIRIVEGGLGQNLKSAQALLPSNDILSSGGVDPGLLPLDPAQVKFGPELILLWREGGSGTVP